MKDETFENLLVGAELDAWHAIKKLITGLLGKNRAADYVQSVGKVI